MNLIREFYPETDIQQFVNLSTPATNYNFQLYKGKEDAGWVNFYFKYNESEFEVLITLAAYDLTDIVIFFENITNLKEETAVFLFITRSSAFIIINKGISFFLKVFCS